MAAALAQFLGSLKVSRRAKEEKVEELVFAVAELDTLPGNVLPEAWLTGREATPPLRVVR